MFPISWAVAIASLLIFALLGSGIGAVTGWLVALITRSRPAALLKDGVLGSLGFLAGFFAAALMPWPRNTITYPLGSGTIAASTMNRYQHPERVAIFLAILLPLLNELYRWRKRQTTSLS